MKSILSYDSPIMSLLRGVSNTMFLNMLFLLCCLPVVTIGAAWTALFAGCRVMQEDGPCFKTFFKTFFKSFKRATLAWLVQFPVLLLTLYMTMSVWHLRMSGMPFGQVSLVISIIAIVIVLMWITMTYLFYSKFECTLKQLLKNGAYMMVGYLIRSVLITALCWGPFFLMCNTRLFGQGMLVYILLYFGIAAGVSVWLMKRPFKRLVDDFVEEHGEPEKDYD